MNNIGTISYAIAALAHVALAIVVVFKWGNRPGSRQFLLTLFVSVLWALGLAYYTFSGRSTYFGIVVLLELLRTAMWILLVWRLLFGGERENWPRGLAYKVYGGLIAVIALNAVIFALAYFGIRTLNPGSVYIVSLFALAVMGYLLIYQYYRNSDAEHRWRIKFICFGVGGLFVYDLVVFSLGVLFRGIEGDLWSARGMVNALVVPLLMVSVGRMEAQKTKFRFREILFSIRLACSSLAAIW